MNEIDIHFTIEYKDIPNFPVSTVEGHKGALLFGMLGGKSIVAMQGRFHYYEGYSMQEVVFPIRVMKMLGIEYLLLSNASGGTNDAHEIGDLMLITDHINLFFDNPLRGRNIDELGPRFPDMSNIYNKELIKKAEQSLIQEKILKDTSGESYLALYKNIEKVIEGNVPSFGISDHVIQGMSNNKKIKEYMSCMQGIMQSPNFKDSKLSEFIKLSSSGNNNPTITSLVSKMLLIFEAKDFEQDFYKYLTFSLIDKFNPKANPSKGKKEKP